MRRRARTDANHAAVTQALRSVGWTVVDTSRVHGGFPDLLAIRRGQMELIEVKDGAKSASRRQLTDEEAKFHQALAAAGVTVKVIASIDEAVNL